MWKYFTNYLRTQTFAGRTAAKCNIDQQFVSERPTQDTTEDVTREVVEAVMFSQVGETSS